MEKTTSPKQLTSQEKMARGSAWMTFGNIFSRLLGAIYIIPWYAWMGEHGKAANGLFNMGYNFYALFLMISTAGIPGAIAKQIAKYNSLHEYRTSRQVFIRALQLMVGVGIFFGGLMYFSASWLAKISGGGDSLVPVIRSLSIAILAFPCMSVIRGYFQGNQNLMPFAMSQIVEQVARVFYMLLATFIIMKVLAGDYAAAVTQSTFAAFIGMIGSFAVLGYFLKKDKLRSDILVERSQDQLKISQRELLLDTIKEAIPFIIVGSGVTIFKLVDQLTFIRTMAAHTSYSHAQLVDLYSIFSANPDKLTMVVIALATSISSAGLPLITEMVTQKNHRELAKLVSNNLQLFAFVMIPAALGMILLAYPLNTVFYGPDALGSSVLVQACVAALPTGLFMVACTMLQGMFENRPAVVYFLTGFIVKLILQVPMIRVFEVYGPLMATIIGFSVTCALALRKIMRLTNFNSLLTLRRVVLIFLMSVVMCVAAFILRQLFGLAFSRDHRLTAFVLVVLTAGAGGGLYAYIALKIRLADKLIGNGARTMRKKLHIK